MSRIGLGRHGRFDSDAGDPLDGLVNLFDVGIVLAVAFLIAGLSMSGSPTKAATPKDGSKTKITVPTNAPTVAGSGTSVGQVYQLPDGSLVLVKPGQAPP